MSTKKLSENIIPNQAYEHISKSCGYMQNLIETRGKISSEKRPFDFETFVRTIVSQQLSTSAARSILLRLKSKAGKKSDSINARDFNSFDELSLRDCGVSPNKAQYIKNIANMIMSNELDLDEINKSSTEDARQKLLEIKGIGPWSADIILLFNLGRLEVFPTGDISLEKGFKKLTNNVDADVYSYSSNWNPFQGVAALYIWDFVDNPPP